MKRTDLLLRAAFAIFLVAIIVSSVAISVLAVGNNSYTPPFVSDKTEIFGGDVLKDKLSIAISDAEMAYLRERGDFVISYPAGVSSAYVDTEYDSESKTLTVTARAYSYLSDNGVTVVWTPSSLAFRGDDVAFDSENKVVLTPVLIDSDNTLSIKYTTSFIIGKDEVNRLLNFAYNTTPDVVLEIEQCRLDAIAARERYYKNVELYEEYLALCAEYEAKMVVYRQYLSAKKIYDEAYLEYTDYLDALDDYNTQKAAYEDYLLKKEQYYRDYAVYVKYLDYASKYQEKVEAYDAYVKKLDKINSQLSVIEATKTPMTHLNRTVYSAIMGDTVTSVIANKDAIANEIVGASSAAVDLAGNATESLRNLFYDYFSLTTDAQKYNYYTLNYEAFCDAFSDLLAALDNLYSNKRVRGILIAQGKQEKYIILLAQLYCIANALNDAPVSNFEGNAYFDSSYLIGKGYSDAKTPREVLGNSFIVDTNTATPIHGGYPMAVEKPEYTLMQEPQMPTPVSLPTPPEEVAEPTAPAVVDRPIEPEVISHPGTLPPLYEAPDYLTNIISEYPNLSPRAEIDYDLVYTVEIFSSRDFTKEKDVTVSFYDSEINGGAEPRLLYTTCIEKGGMADYLGKLPEKLEDREAIYSFSHWTDALGKRVDLSSVEESVNLYPAFSAEYKQYNVVWEIDGVVYYENPGIPTRADDGVYMYEFAGWTPRVSEESGDVTYVAKFSRKYILPLYSGTGADVSVSEGKYVVNVHGYTGRLDISGVLSRATSIGPLTITSDSWEIVFSYAEVVKMYEAGVAGLEISVISRVDGGYVYSYILTDDGHNPSSYKAKATLNFKSDIADNDSLIIFTKNGNEESYVRYTSANSLLSFQATAGASYYAILRYTVGILPSELVEFSVDKTSAVCGEYVSVDVRVPKGVTLVGAYIIDESGTRLYIDGGFTMPDGDVRLGIDAYKTEYTVTFISEGKVLLTYSCHYGDIPTPPDDPRRAASKSFSYTFIGWSIPLDAVCDDVEFVAMYTASRIERNDDGGLAITPSVLKILLPTALSIVILTLGIIPSFIISLVMAKKRRTRLGIKDKT